MYYLPCTRGSTVLHALLYVSGKSLTPPHPTTYSPRKIHTKFTLSEIIFYVTSRIVNSGTTYQEVFPSKKNLTGRSHFSCLIIAKTFNTVDWDINKHYNRMYVYQSISIFISFVLINTRHTAIWNKMHNFLEKFFKRISEHFDDCADHENILWHS